MTPDLAIFGKAIANGFPVAAVAGRADLMDLCATGGVLHGGTYNAQPLAMAATSATLKSLTPALYETIAGNGTRLMEGLRAIFASANITATVTGFPQVFHVALGMDAPARDYRELARMNRPGYVVFATALLERGVRVLERGAWFMSSEHDESVVDETLAAAADAIGALKRRNVL